MLCRLQAAVTKPLWGQWTGLGWGSAAAPSAGASKAETMPSQTWGPFNTSPLSVFGVENPLPVTLFSEIRIFRPPAMVPRVPLNARVEVLSPKTCERELVWKWGVCRGWALIWHDCVLTEKRCLHLETQMWEETARRHVRCRTGRAGTGGGAPQAVEQWRAEGADREPARQPVDETLASQLGENRSHHL